MKLKKFTGLFLISLFSFIYVASPPFVSQAADILKFEPDDTLEEIRAKIEHNEYHFTVNHNWVFDMPQQEKGRFFSRRASPFPKEADTHAAAGPLLEHLGKRQLPSTFDWRDHNGHTYIGPIRDQGSCGSCYSFGACAAAEGVYNWAYGQYDGNCVDFSESYVIWCLGRLTKYNSHFYGWDGADYTYAELESLTTEGVTREANFPYTTSDPGSCSHWEDPTTVFEDWHRIDCNDVEGIKTAIMTYGVVVAAVYVGSAFQAYSGGIYEDSNTTCTASPCYYTSSNHCVALVGWNDNGGDGYWILRNSWGTTWGENGYMRIKYTSAVVACSVAYLTIESPTGIAVTPSEDFSSEGPSGGPFNPATKTYTVKNQSDTGINFSVSKGEEWLSLSPPGGYLAPLGTTEVTTSINANANSLPNGTYTDTLRFVNATSHIGDTTRHVTLEVGAPFMQHSWDMNTDPEWNSQGLWAWGQPAGGGGQYGGPDPSSGYTGNTVYGYNLSGDYENFLSEKHLTTKAIDCTNLSHVTLKFKRWLGVERPSYDHADVRVSNDGSTWTTIWNNSDEITDTSWQPQKFDISSVADGQATVYVRWTMGPTDDWWQYCGWNIDDVQIWGVQVTSSPTISYVSNSLNCYERTPCYASIQAAVDAATDGEEIRISQGTYAESIVLDTPKSITLKGGWNGSFTSQSANTTFIKAPKVSQGSLRIEMSIIRP